MNAAAISELQPDHAKSKGTELRVREETARPRFIPKTHVAFWRTRVERRTYEYEGKTLEVPEYSVRMKFGGIRRRLALGTALNLKTAVEKRRSAFPATENSQAGAFL